MTIYWLIDEIEAPEGVAAWNEHPYVHIAHTAKLEAWRQAAVLIKDSQLVAFPTETVYGLGANALDSLALQKVFAAKNRPLDNPLIAHIADMPQLDMLTTQVSPLEMRIMETFWPGPLSILLPARSDLPQELTANLPQVAVRMPAHELALGLIRAVGKPLAAPSANLSGRPSPTSGMHVLEDLAGRIAGVIDGGNCHVGIESTVIEVQGGDDARIIILRPGAIDEHALSQFGVPVELDPHLQHRDTDAVPRAPGQKYRHYAPKGSLQVVFCDDEEIFWEYAKEQVGMARAQGKKIALLTNEREIGADVVLPLGHTPTEAASRLYRILRECDQAQVEVMLARGFATATAEGIEDPATVALLNRLYKASGGQFIHF